jgi:methylated-DNA-[protein]-cysteine S-methyltransferase
MTDHHDDPLARALRAAAPPDSGAPLPGIAAAAAAAGLLDVAYATLDSPVGRLLLASTDAGLARVAFLDGDVPDGAEAAALAELAQRISPRVLAAPPRLDGPRRQLDEYFAGRRDRFDLPLDWRLARGFGRRVLAATAAIPYGKVATYGEVAGRAGSPSAFRAAGNALGANPLPIVVPCHRVVPASGGIGNYTGGMERKRALLAIEGR